MKQLNILLVALLACMGFVACSNDDEDYKPGKWDANPDYADVYFPVTSVTKELDPAEPTEMAFEVVRRNVGGELSIPVEIACDSVGIFEVTDVKFADGDSVGHATLSFPKAEIGTKYKVELKINGAEYVSEYSAGVLLSCTITRVKWNSLGNCLFADWFFFNGLAEREIQQREDMRNVYRIVDPYFGGINTEEGSEYLMIQVLKKDDECIGQKVPTDGLVYFYSSDSQYYVNTGYFHSSYSDYIFACFPGRFTSLADPSNWTHSYVVNWQEVTLEGDEEPSTIPGKVFLAPYYYMDSAGGWNYTGADPVAGDGGIEIRFPGYKEPYQADIETDFEWEEVFEGAFTSNLLGTSSNVTLMKGTCVNKTDDCDSVFNATYGTAYALIDPYGPDAPLYFGVKDGKVTAPYVNKVLEDMPSAQPTGMKALGVDVYATINHKSSTFSENEIVLNITFTNAKGDMEYGTTNEVIANITWTKVATGTYTYSQFFEGDDPDIELFVRDDKPNLYKIEHWGNDVDFFFTWDKKTNKCEVEEQYIGYTHASYGPVWVMEAPNYNAALSTMPSYFDPETNTFNFGVIYFVEAGYLGYGYETFTLAPAAAAAPAKVAKAEKTFTKDSLVKGMKRTQKLVGKKVAKVKGMDKPLVMATMR